MKTKLNMSVLCLVLLTALSACGGETVPAETQETGAFTSSIQTETETAEPVPDIPDTVDYNGATFTLEAITQSNAALVPVYNAFSIEAETGDLLNDIVYKAVSNVEEKLNIELKNTFSKDAFDYGHLKKAAVSGDGSVDAFSYIDRFGTAQAAGGYVIPYEQIPTIHLENPWWFQDVNDAITIAGHLCFAVGAMNLDLTSNMFAILYNKQIYDSAQFETSPYDLVEAGKWTVDSMYKMMEDVTADLDGDGKMAVSDLWGAVYTHDVWYNAFGPLSGTFIVEKDSEDIPHMSVVGNEQLITIWQKLLNHKNENTAFIVNKLGDTKLYKLDSSLYNEVLYMFKDGKALFSSTSKLANVALLRDMKDDYGILPFPHMEEEAPGTVYGSYFGGIGQPYFIPTSNVDIERTGYVFEALCYEYYRNVISTYLDDIATVKQVRDEQSSKMLQMMSTKRCVDISAGYWWEETNAQMYDVFRSGADTFVSTYEKNQSKAESAIEKTVETFRGFDE